MDFSQKALCIAVTKIIVQDSYDSFLNIINLHSFANALLWEYEPLFHSFSFSHFYSVAIWSNLIYFHSHPHFPHGLAFIHAPTTDHRSPLAEILVWHSEVL